MIKAELQELSLRSYKNKVCNIANKVLQISYRSELICEVTEMKFANL